MTAGGADFVFADGAVSVLQNGISEKHILSGVLPGSPDRKLDRLQATAGGREVWATTRSGSRCVIHRYQ